MMLPTFTRWVAELALYYTRPNWPTEENVAQAFRDVKHMDGQALDFIGSFIRTSCEEWPKSLSNVMHKGYAAWNLECEERRKAEEREKLSWTPPTPEQAARNQQRCSDLIHALRTGIRPPWADDPRGPCCQPLADSYQRGRKA